MKVRLNDNNGVCLGINKIIPEITWYTFIACLLVYIISGSKITFSTLAFHLNSNRVFKVLLFHKYTWVSQKFCNIFLTLHTVWQLLMLLPKLCRWWTMQDCEILSLPDTLWVLLTGFLSMAWRMAMESMQCTTLAHQLPLYF